MLNGINFSHSNRRREQSRNMENEFMKRGYLLPEGCKDLMDALKLKGPQYLSARSLPLILPEKAIKVWGAKAFKWAKAFKAAIPNVPIKGVLTIPREISVVQLAAMLGQKPFQIIADMMMLGVFLDKELDFKTASRIAQKHGFIVKRAE
jgi:hypothetical protein